MKTLMICLITLLWGLVAHASWLSEMIDDNSNLYSGASSYESQKMGYNSMGGMQKRIPLKRDPLVSVAPPSFDVGCGGIDVFMGGIGFMNADYLVAKLKRSLSAAPYVAFDLGLKSLCSECSEVIKTVEQMANALNSMDFDECAAAKTMVTAAIDGTSMVARNGRDINSTLESMREGVNSGLDSFFEDSKPQTKDEKNKIQDNSLKRLPTSIAKRWAENGGSLLDLIRVEFNIPVASINTARAYFGDIYLDKDNNNFVPVLKCETEGTSMDDIIRMQMVSRTVNSVANASSATSCVKDDIPLQLSTEALIRVADVLQSGEALNQKTIDFVNRANLPIFAILARAKTVSPQYGNTMRDFMTPITAGSFVYTPLSAVASAIMLALDDIDAQQQTDSYYANSNIEVQKYRDDVYKAVSSMRALYNEQLSQNYNLWQMIASINSDDENIARMQVAN